jgi:hypothetical protein
VGFFLGDSITICDMLFVVAAASVVVFASGSLLVLLRGQWFAITRLPLNHRG